MAHFFQNELTAARLICTNCSSQYYLHSLQPPTDLDPVVPPTHPSSSSALSQISVPAPSWTTTTMGLPPTGSSTSSFRQWGLGLDSSSAESTATVNDRRVAATQRHQPAPYGLPVPARGVAQNPLHLPTITLPRVTRTAAAARSVRNPRSHVQVGTSSSQSHPQKIIDYKFACVILPIGVSQIFGKKKSMRSYQSCR